MKNDQPPIRKELIVKKIIKKSSKSNLIQKRDLKYLK
jgi:hypothetical protein